MTSTNGQAPRPRPLLWLVIWSVVALGFEAGSVWLPRFGVLASGLTLLDLAAIIAGLLAMANLLASVTLWWLLHRRKPASGTRRRLP